MKSTLRTLLAVVPAVLTVLILSQSGFAKKNAEGPLNQVDVNGKRQGHWIITAAMMKYGAPWSPTQIVMDGEYKDSRRIGTWTVYHENRTYTLWIFDEEQKHVSAQHYSDSILLSETNYRLTVHERLEKFESGGQTNVMKVPHEFLLHEGVAKTCYDDGTLWMEMTWKDGRLDGPAKTYYPNGKLCEEGTWKYTCWDMNSPYVFHKK